MFYKHKGQNQLPLGDSKAFEKPPSNCAIFIVTKNHTTTFFLFANTIFV